MKFHPIFFEPELHASIFLLVNLTGILLVHCLTDASLFSKVWLICYTILVILINHGVSAGRYYLPTKSLRDRTVVITGATSGIGRACALRFAKLGARVIIGVRGQERAERVAKELCRESRSGMITGHDLDLSSLISVKNFAAKIQCVHILLNNASIFTKTYTLTTDGFERQFGVNHIGHFYLTQLLLPLLTHARVVNVTGTVHHWAPLTGIDYSFSKLKREYKELTAHAISKLAQIYHASELTRRYGIKAYSLHPGLIANAKHKKTTSFSAIIFGSVLSLIGKNVEQGAMTCLYCALSEEAKPGHFHSDCQVRQPSRLALDQYRAEECWNETERLIQERKK